jgi:hypothetical protein
MCWRYLDWSSQAFCWAIWSGRALMTITEMVRAALFVFICIELGRIGYLCVSLVVAWFTKDGWRRNGR